MSTFARTPQGDLALTAPDPVTGLRSISLVTDPAQAAAIKLTDNLSLVQGEWFLNVNEGMPFYQRVFVKNPILGDIRAMFRNAILATLKTIFPSPTVVETTVTLNARRQLAYNFVAHTGTGATITGGSGQPFEVTQ